MKIKKIELTPAAPGSWRTPAGYTVRATTEMGGWSATLCDGDTVLAIVAGHKTCRASLDRLANVAGKDWR